jgi:hypothetical protein
MPVCSVQAVKLHSYYDPMREAERFAAAQNPSCGSPAAVIVTEPALSYCKPFLASRFPLARCYALRYTAGEFRAADTCWDGVLHGENKDAEAIAEELFTLLGEETLFNTAFLSWGPSERAFPEISTVVWRGIQQALSKARDVLATREYFSKRWLKNAVRFIQGLRLPALAERGEALVVIAASGPSLAGCLPFIREFREHFFLIALSSALEALVRAHITPDICMSSDGGYWAKTHLSHLYRLPSVPLACSAESALPAVLLSVHPVIPLCYGDGLESLLLQSRGIPAMRAGRNGTVSGTAAEFALSITTGDVFFCGLDLAPGKGFQHTQPNLLELAAQTEDFRLRPAAYRYAASAFSSGALVVYRRWFAQQNDAFTSRIYRISASPAAATLGKIRDMSLGEAKTAIGHLNSLKKPAVYVRNDNINQKRKNLAYFSKRIKKNTSSDVLLRAIFPAQYISILRGENPEQEKKALQKKLDVFLSELEVFTDKLEKRSDVR